MLTGQAVIGWIFLAQRSDAVGIIEHQRTDARAMRGEHGFAGGPPVGTVCGTVDMHSLDRVNMARDRQRSSNIGPRCDRCMSTLRFHASTQYSRRHFPRATTKIFLRFIPEIRAQARADNIRTIHCLSSTLLKLFSRPFFRI